MLYRVHLSLTGFELTTLVMIGNDFIGSCKSNYPTITTTTAYLVSVGIQGRIQGGAPAPPKIGKNMISWCKIVIFHTKYPQNFRASLRSSNFFKCAPPILEILDPPLVSTTYFYNIEDRIKYMMITLNPKGKEFNNCPPIFSK
jgi:hypothetical protein